MKILKIWEFRNETFIKTDKGFYGITTPERWVRFVCKNGEWQPMKPIRGVDEKTSDLFYAESRKITLARLRNEERIEELNRHQRNSRWMGDESEAEFCFNDAYGDWCN